MDPTSWLVPTVGLIVGLFGGGTLTTLIQAKSDRKRGIGELEVAQDDAVAQRWQAIVNTQAESLISPLTKRIEDLEEDVVELRTKLDASMAKYWRAVTYIRKLQSYIIKHLPDGQKPPPDPPADIAEDI